MAFRSGFKLSVLTALLLFSMAGSIEAQGLVLRYKFQGDATFGYEMKTWANVPFHKDGKVVRGEITAVSRVDYRVTEASTHTANLSADMEWEATPSLEAGTTSATFQVNDLGQVSNLQSPDLDDPEKSLIIRNMRFCFPLVPTEPVNIGSTWEWPVTLIVKAVRVLNPELRLSELEVDVTFKVIALAVEDGQQIVKLHATAKERPGTKYKVKLAGPMDFNLDAGRIQKGFLAGTVKKKIAFITITVPVKVWINPN